MVPCSSPVDPNCHVSRDIKVVEPGCACSNVVMLEIVSAEVVVFSIFLLL